MPIIPGNAATHNETNSFPGFDELWTKYPSVASIKFYDVDGEGVTEIDAYDADGEWIDPDSLNDGDEDLIWETEQDLFYLCKDACPGYYAVKGVVTRNSNGTYTFTNHRESTYTSPTPKS